MAKPQNDSTFVDDDEDDYALFCDALQAIIATPTCLRASDGQKALDILRNVLPDYIFLDVNMPVMGGEECLINIRKSKTLRAIPVIVYSTTSQPKEIQTFKDLGAKDFLVKPGTFEELVVALTAIVT